MAGHDNFEDVAIWEAIASQVAPLIDTLWRAIADGIPEDTTLRGFQNRREDIPRLQLVMINRANKWIQAVYNACAEAWKKTGKPMPANFDRAIWKFAIEPFIDQRLKELLLRAAGWSPLDQPRQLRTWQRQCCDTVKGEISERWWKKLIGRAEDQSPPVSNEPRPERNGGSEAPGRNLAEAAAAIATGLKWEAALRIATGKTQAAQPQAAITAAKAIPHTPVGDFSDVDEFVANAPAKGAVQSLALDLPPTPLPPPLRAPVEDIVEESPALDAAPSAVVAQEEDLAPLDGSTPAAEPVNFRSPTKRAIRRVLLREQYANNKRVCALLEEDQDDEKFVLPDEWQTPENTKKSFKTAYCDEKVRVKIHNMIDKVRRGMIEGGELSSPNK